MSSLITLLTFCPLLLSVASATPSPSPQHLTLNKRSTQQKLNSSTVPLVSTLFGTDFDVNVTVGGQTIPLLVDTGSSDTYVMRSGYTCYNLTDGLELPQSSCFYGNATYSPTNTYADVPGEIFGVQYGDGIAAGVMAHEDVTLGGIIVKQAIIGVANRSTPMGDGVNSGLLGLAYPALTSAHPANITDNTTFFYNRETYDPLLFTMHKQGLIDPYFSLALARTPQNESTGFGGYLSLGGLPAVPHSNDFTVVPVEIDASVPIAVTSNQSVRAYWTLSVSNIKSGPGNASTFPSTAQPNNITTSQTLTNSTTFQAFLDNGNYFTFLPNEVTTQINTLFSPPATYDNSSGSWLVDCAATPPQVGLTIGNATFFLDGRDLTYQTSDPSAGQGQCISSIMSSTFAAGIYGDIQLHILGAAFFKNVLTVFVFGEIEIRLAKLQGEVLDGAQGGQGGSSGGAGGLGGNFTNAANRFALTVRTSEGRYSLYLVALLFIGAGVLLQ